MKHLFLGEADVPRPRKAPFSPSNTSSKSPAELMAEIQYVLNNNHISYYVKKFSLVCSSVVNDETIQFELEVNAVPRLKETYFVHPTRIAGNEWTFKSVVDQLFVELKL